MEQEIEKRAEEIGRQLVYSGFTPLGPIYDGNSKTVSIDIKECFDGIWQHGVEVTTGSYYVYRKLIQPLLDDYIAQDNDVVIDFVTPSLSSVIGYISSLSRLQGVE